MLENEVATMPVAEETIVETTQPVVETPIVIEEPKPITIPKYNGKDMPIFEADRVRQLSEMGLYYEEKGKGELEKYRGYDNAIKMLENEATTNGYTSIDEYVNAVEKATKDQELVNKAAEYGVDEGLAKFLNEIQNKPQEKPIIREELIDNQAKQDTEIAEFVAKYKDIDTSVGKFPQSVIDKWSSGEMSLINSYENYLNDTIKQENQSLKNELLALKGIQENSNASIGSVANVGVVADSIFISKDVFEANKSDMSWVKKNLSNITKSQNKW